MKNKKIYMDFFLGVIAIVMILFSAKALNMSSSREESGKEYKDDSIPAPALLQMYNQSFQKQSDDSLTDASILSNVNNQFDYQGNESNTSITYLPILY